MLSVFVEEDDINAKAAALARARRKGRLSSRPLRQENVEVLGWCLLFESMYWSSYVCAILQIITNDEATVRFFDDDQFFKFWFWWLMGFFYLQEVAVEIENQDKSTLDLNETKSLKRSQVRSLFSKTSVSQLPVLSSFSLGI